MKYIDDYLELIINKLILFKKTFKKIILNFLRKFDLDIIRYSKNKPTNFIGKKIHPISLNYLSNKRYSILNLKLSIGRTSRFYSLEKNSFDPHLYSIKKSLKKNFNEDLIHKNILFSINKSKELIKIKDLFDFYGLKKSSNTILKKYPFWSNILPWDNINIRDQFKYFPLSVKADRIRNGLNIKSDSISEIMRIDEQYSASSHVNQYISLLTSIKNKGYILDNDNNYIEADILIKGNDYRWKVSGEGNHRAIILSTLGYIHAPCKVIRIIRFNEAKYWPNVINGTFSIREAQIIFSRFFNANPPKSYESWNNFCKKNL